jgi:hypothetical protein
MEMRSGRPDDSEFAPFAKGYVDLVEGSDIVEILPVQTAAYLALVRGFERSFSYAPGKWSVKEVIGHVTDAERIFSYRTLCVARGDKTPFPGFEQDDYMVLAGFNERSLTDLIGEFELVREATIHMLRSFQPAAWSRRGTVSGCSVTTRGLAFQLAGHERHHARILREKYLT